MIRNKVWMGDSRSRI